MLNALDGSRTTLLLLALSCTGCLSATVFDYRGDAPVMVHESPPETTLVVNDLAFPLTRTAVIGAQAAPVMKYGEVRFVALEEHLNELLSQSLIARDVRRARDLSRDGIDGPGFVVQYTLRTHDASTSTDDWGMAAAIIATTLLPPFGTLSLFSVTHRIEHQFDLEVRLYRVEDAELISTRALGSGELVAQYDTGGAELLWRTTKQLTIESGHCASCTPQGADADRFHRKEGRQMARVIFQETSSELREQMERSIAARPRPTRTPAVQSAVLQRVNTAGGEAPAFESTVRARLDDRAEPILLCANTDAAVLIVEWSGPGPVSVTLRDADDDTSACAAATLGALEAPADTPAGRVVHVVSR